MGQLSMRFGVPSSQVNVLLAADGWRVTVELKLSVQQLYKKVNFTENIDL